MAIDTAQSGQFEPLHAAHAIEQLVLVLQLNRQLSDEELLSVRRAMISLQSELPATQQLRALNFALINGTPSVAPSEVDAGLSLSCIGKNGSVEKELKLERQSITYRCTVYTRWAEVRADCLRYFATLLPHFHDDILISALGLTFVDKFVWTGNSKDASPKNLLADDSPYFGRYVFDLNDMWHAHTGAFLSPSVETKRLLNINIDCVDELGSEVPKRVVGISTVATDMLNQPGYAPCAIDAHGSLEFLTNRIDQLHSVLKDVFGKLINQDMKARINLLTSS